MPRPQIQRQIGYRPTTTHFKPQGIPLRMLETIELATDELEAVRLTDLEGLYQEQAAEQMGVSRQTLGLILKRAHKKIAEALIQGKAIQLEVAEPAVTPLAPRRGGHGRGRGCGCGCGRR
jgi:predicted DNA-binding protein (UPF0251 family)